MTAAGLHPKARPGWRDDATAAIDAMSRRDRRRLYVPTKHVDAAIDANEPTSVVIQTR